MKTPMTARDDVVRELEDAPEPILQEVLELLRARKRTSAPLTALLSEPSLARDWLGPEEDEAWADL